MSLLLCLCLTGLPECNSSPEIYTPDQFLANAKELYRKELTVRLRVSATPAETVINVPKNTKYKQIRILPQSAGIKNATFHVNITPEAEKDFKRLGITDLHKHFEGKEIEVKGYVEATLMQLYLSPTFYFYHINIHDLDQIRMIKPVSEESSEPEKE